MFGTILTLTVTLMQLYVFARAASLPFLQTRARRRWIWIAGSALWLLFAMGRWVGHDSTGVVAGALEAGGMAWMGFLFVTATMVLVADLVTGFGLWARRAAPALRGAALVAGVALSLLALVQGVRPPAIVEYQVRMPGLPAGMDGTTIVAISDTHLGSQLGPAWLLERVVQVMALKPDLIVLLGDIFEGHGRVDADLLPPLKRLSAPLGAWAVSGNHESYGRGKSLVLLEEAGITVLHDRWAEVAPGLVLAGVDDLTSRRRRGAIAGPITMALAGRPPGAAILLSHTPWQAEEARAAGAGLMLSGHTHNGQLWPFNYLVALEYPMVGGRYEAAGMPVLVCRGTGTWGPRMRLWRRGEILLVTLRRA